MRSVAHEARCEIGLSWVGYEPIDLNVNHISARPWNCCGRITLGRSRFSRVQNREWQESPAGISRGVGPVYVGLRQQRPRPPGKKGGTCAQPAPVSCSALGRPPIDARPAGTARRPESESLPCPQGCGVHADAAEQPLVTHSPTVNPIARDVADRFRHTPIARCSADRAIRRPIRSVGLQSLPRAPQPAPCSIEFSASLMALGACLERVVEDLVQGSMDDVHGRAGAQIGLLLHEPPMLPGIRSIPLDHAMDNLFPLADRGPLVGGRLPQTVVQSAAQLQSSHGSLLHSFQASVSRDDQPAPSRASAGEPISGHVLVLFGRLPPLARGAAAGARVFSPRPSHRDAWPPREARTRPVRSS
jgi:hypothetical protein